MKMLAIIIFTFSVLMLSAQDINPEFDGQKWVAPYSLPIPDGWNVERFQIPIDFAPGINYKGVEDIRFAPGWAKANSDEYWSYAFLWYLDGDITMTSKTLEQNLRDYYNGLLEVNGKRIPPERLLSTETSFGEVTKHREDLHTFEGTINMIDYLAQIPITLNCRLHLRKCAGENKTFLFFELSPKAFNHNIWMGLDSLWIEFRCKA